MIEYSAYNKIGKETSSNKCLLCESVLAYGEQCLVKNEEIYIHRDCIESLALSDELIPNNLMIYADIVEEIGRMRTLYKQLLDGDLLPQEREEEETSESEDFSIWAVIIIMITVTMVMLVSYYLIK